MKKGIVLSVVTAALAGLTACGGSGEFCQVSREAGNFDPQSPRALDFLNRAVEAAPDEVRGDVVTLRDAVQSIQQADTAEERAALAGKLDSINQAAENLSNWEQQNC